MIELEYKYTLTERKRITEFLDLGVRRLPTQQLSALYFNDTQGLLKQAHYSLRLRREDDLYLLTLKAPSKLTSLGLNETADPALQSRYEWGLRSWTEDDYPLDVNDLAEDSVLQCLPSWLRDAVGESAQTLSDQEQSTFSQTISILLSIPQDQWYVFGGTRITRFGCLLRDHDADWQLTIDDGVLFAGENVIPCLELELEYVGNPISSTENALDHPLVGHPLNHYLVAEASSKHERIFELTKQSQSSSESHNNGDH